jgi:hypothetical protein
MARSPLDDVLELGVRGLGEIGKVGTTPSRRDTARYHSRSKTTDT